MSEDFYSDMMAEKEKMKATIMAQAQQQASPNMSMFNGQSDENMLKWQLDMSEDLDRIYHLLKASKIEVDAEGNIQYKENKDKSMQMFNDHGVQILMNILAFYLNRNTILSNYDEQTIKNKVYDFGIEISDLIFNKYQMMGMDTHEKQKFYPMIVRELTDTVHSAYLRAFNGGERTSLRKNTSYSEVNNGIGMQNPNGIQPPQKQVKWYAPTSWR